MFIYPNGGEIITEPYVYITWIEPASYSGSNLWYEIYFSDSWTFDKEPDWIQIAVLPADNYSYLWDIPSHVSSEKCRLAMRVRTANGNRTPYILSADTFIVRKQNLIPPSIISPVENSRYQQFVPIIIDYGSVVGTGSERGSYQIYYSSGGDENWRVIQENIRVGSEPLYWDVRDLPVRDDYVVKIVMTDSYENSSIPVFVRNLKIFPMNYFIFDTQPPVGTINVVNDQDFTNERNIILSLRAFDESTGIKSVSIRENFNGTKTTGTEQEMADMKTWYVAGTDGLRYIESIFKDYGGNSVNENDIGEFFRKYVGNNNEQISCILLVLDGTDLTLWTAFGGSAPVLFQNRSLHVSLTGETTAMEVFNGFLYIGVEKDEHKGTLQKMEGTTIRDIYSFTTKDTLITQMRTMGNHLYIGLQNGELYDFDGTTLVFAYDFGSQIESLCTEGSLLYVGVENTETAYTYDGSNPPILTEVTDGYLQV